MKRAKGTDSRQPRVAMRGSIVMAVVAIYFAFLWHKGTPPPRGEVFGYSAEGKPLYAPVAHDTARRRVTARPDGMTTPPSGLARAWVPPATNPQP